jgi:hypothetical protein
LDSIQFDSLISVLVSFSPFHELSGMEATGYDNNMKKAWFALRQHDLIMPATHLNMHLPQVIPIVLESMTVNAEAPSNGRGRFSLPKALESRA